MQITDVRVRKITAEGKMKAIVSVTFDNEFVVHDIERSFYSNAKQKNSRWGI
jgi:DNA-binding cell septation regulator SpoVG